MLDSFIPLVIMSLSIAVAVWLIFMWAVKSGQFDDIEGPKHRMLDDDDEEPNAPHKDDEEQSKGDEDDENT